MTRTKNGAVSASEYQTFMNGAFTNLDANGNGSLSAAETSKVLTPAQFSTLDANGNGSVDKKEFMTQVMKDFASADKSGDGQLK
ncbi:EF-hand domain-containing protein [Mesorhizobium sp. GR13]|uniref:EF-hand domain-containing protein n=1 Tax=Mesorhizobium sp. GR13 TaxID=2562308 RepID=UPI001FEF759D|nr:EF-hand domain-containing protein [Mesorhizobium sp. GR13]